MDGEFRRRHKQMPALIGFVTVEPTPPDPDAFLVLPLPHRLDARLGAVNGAEIDKHAGAGDEEFIGAGL